jgi:C4-dicarboxylate transporter DctQ subunit
VRCFLINLEWPVVFYYYLLLSVAIAVRNDQQNVKPLKQATGRLETVAKWFDRVGFIGGAISACLNIVMILLITFSVFQRRVFNDPQFWTEEIVAYIFVCFFFFTLGYCTIKESHVSTDLLISHAPPKVQFAMTMVGYVIICFFCIVMIYSGGQMAFRYISLDWKSSSPLESPLWPVVTMIPLGFAIFLLTALSRIYVIRKRFQTTCKVGASHDE